VADDKLIDIIPPAAPAAASPGADGGLAWLLIAGLVIVLAGAWAWRNRRRLILRWRLYRLERACRSGHLSGRDAALALARRLGSPAGSAAPARAIPPGLAGAIPEAEWQDVRQTLADYCFSTREPDTGAVAELAGRLRAEVRRVR